MKRKKMKVKKIAKEKEITIFSIFLGGSQAVSNKKKKGKNK
jgi:hypothetical protein